MFFYHVFLYSNSPEILSFSPPYLYNCMFFVFSLINKDKTKTTKSPQEIHKNKNQNKQKTNNTKNPKQNETKSL